MNEKLKDALENIDFSLGAFKSVNDDALLMLTKILEPCGEGGVALLEEGLLDGEFVPVAEPYPQGFKPVTAIRYWKGRLEAFLADYKETEQGWDILLRGKWVSDVESLSIDWWFLLSELKDRLDEHTPGYKDEVELATDAVENEDIYLHDPEAFGDDREFCIGMEFRDGEAVGQSVTLTYPKLSDLTPDEIREIDEYTGGRVFDSGVITPMDVALKFGKVVSFGVMDETNGHNPALVKQLNVRWMEDQQMFKDILCALYHRDIEEIRDSNTYNWGDKNIYDICMYMYEHWADEASNYLKHIADDQDLETIIKYVRYDRSEH